MLKLFKNGKLKRVKSVLGNKGLRTIIPDMHEDREDYIHYDEKNIYITHDSVDFRREWIALPLEKKEYAQIEDLPFNWSGVTRNDQEGSLKHMLATKINKLQEAIRQDCIERKKALIIEYSTIYKNEKNVDQEIEKQKELLRELYTCDVRFMSLHHEFK